MKQTEDFHTQLRATARLLSPIAPQLLELPKDQIEEVILWLKDHHNPPDDDETGREARRHFNDQLGALKNSEEQQLLQSQAVRHAAWALGCGVSIGVVFCAGLLTALATDSYWTTAIIVGGAVCYLSLQGYRLCIQAIRISKKQELHHHL